MVSQEDYIAFNQYNGQLNALGQQKNQIRAVIDNIDDSIKEAQKSTTKEVFKNLGQILIKTDPKTIVEDLKSEKENLSVRLKTIEKQEDLVSKKLDSIKAKLEAEQKKEEKKN